jgi:predicted transcriptional regulator
MSEIVGSAAGVLWNYLSAQGPTSVSKLSKETELDTKTVQRALGWLDREDKLNFVMKGRTELVALK